MITHKIWDKASPINNIPSEEVLLRRPDLESIKDVLLFLNEDSVVVNIEDPNILKYNLGLTTDDVEEIALNYQLYLTEQDKNFKKKQLSTNDFTDSHIQKLDGLVNYVHPDNADTRHVTDIEKQNWDSKSNFDGNYNSLTQKPTIPTKTSQLTNDANYTTPTGHNHNSMYYPTTEVDTKLSKKTDKTYVDGELTKKADKTTVYIKSDIDTKLNEKADISSVYTIAQANVKLQEKADSTSVYKKGEVDTELYKKADKSTSYTKTELDSMFEEKVGKAYVDPELAKKADKSNTYTKSDIDVEMGKRTTKSYVDGELVKKANISDIYTTSATDVLLGKKADKTNTFTKLEVGSELDKKANLETVYTKTEANNLLILKSDKTYVDTQIGDKASKNDVYSKAQVNDLIGAKSDKNYVDIQLADKANKNDVYPKSDVDTKVGLKSDKVYVDVEIGKKANSLDVYTKLEIGDLSELLTNSKVNFVSAINEVFQLASNGKKLISTAITGMGVGATPTDTFLQLVEKLDSIEVGIKVNGAMNSGLVYGEYLYAGDLVTTDSSCYLKSQSNSQANTSPVVHVDSSPDKLHVVLGMAVSPYYAICKIEKNNLQTIFEGTEATGSLTCSSYSSDGKYLALGFNSAPYFILLSRKENKYSILNTSDIKILEAICFLDFSSDIKHLIVGTANSLNLYKTKLVVIKNEL